jgi:hypothetical protein
MSLRCRELDAALRDLRGEEACVKQVSRRVVSELFLQETPYPPHCFLHVS